MTRAFGEKGNHMVIIGLLCVFVMVVIGLWCWRSALYYATPYAKETGYKFLQVLRDKGLSGEFELSKAIYSFDPKAQVFFNVYIPKEDGTTSEIDALYLAPWGIVVFENKNYSGWIFGKENDSKWVQTFHRNAKYPFPNPIRQNQSHIKALMHFLDLSEDLFVPLVVFSNKVEFKSLDAGSSTVIHTNQVRTSLKRISSHCEERISTNAQEAICEKLAPCIHVSDEIKQQHIENTKSRKSRKRTQADALETPEETASINTQDSPCDPIEQATPQVLPTTHQEPQPTSINESEDQLEKCPRCGADLVLRTTKKGERAGEQFFGCSRFPKCRYIKSLD